MNLITMWNIPSEMITLIMNQLTTMEKIKLIYTCNYLYEHKSMYHTEINVIERICRNEQANYYTIDAQDFVDCMKSVREYTSNNVEYKDIKRGDIISIGFNTLIYNSNMSSSNGCILYVCLEEKAYSIPRQFKVIDEYPIQYWRGLDCVKVHFHF